MKIEFCLAETGDIVFTKNSDELNNIINAITRVGTEINLKFSKSDFIHGYVNNIMYNVDAESNEESLRIFVDRNFKSKKVDALESAKLTPTKLE